jgi:hypothetical protein
MDLQYHRGEGGAQPGHQNSVFHLFSFPGQKKLASQPRSGCQS